MSLVSKAAFHTAAALSLSFVVACGGTETTSDLSIVDGIEIPFDQDPSVVFLYNPTSDGESGSICTGTFVKSNVLITAAHCTEYLTNQRLSGINEEAEDKIFVLGWDEDIDTDEDPSNGISGGYFLIGSSERIFRPSAINSGSIATVNVNDIAIVTFADDVAPAVTPIARSAPRVNATATIIGYGADSINPDASDNSSGTKRKGNVIVDSVGGFIKFSGPRTTTCSTQCGVESNTGPGDSGGPMMYNGEIVGVTSGGNFFNSSNVNLNSSSSRSFINAVEAEIGQTIN